MPTANDNKDSIIRLRTPDVVEAEFRSYGAGMLREAAEEYERGELRNFVMVGQGVDTRWLERASGVEDLVTLLGLIDLAKSCVIERLHMR